ncbi:MAG: T9SS type A sorting domain-containing protein [Bacteroidia bacterium]|nr:T9SS type A sorting domain-containing protein [Bacteroidia bacterium]
MKKLSAIVVVWCICASSHSQTPAQFNITYSGFTPGAQTAFTYAANIWTNTLQSTVPIKVNTYFIPLTPGLLGITFPNGVKDFAGAPQSSTWYATSLANSIAGTGLNTGQFDMDLYLNSSINWYTDTTGVVPAGKYDLVSIVLHELCHGLGFISLAKKSGADGSFGLLQASDFSPLVTSFPWPNLDTLPAILDHFLVNNFSQQLDTFTNPSTTLGTQLTGNNIYFNGTNAVTSNSGLNPRMYAPTTFALGSSILHLNEATYPVGNPNELMTPLSSAGVANHNPGPICIGLLKDIGWNMMPGVGIEENIAAENSFAVYPNPASNSVTISYNNHTTFSDYLISIYDSFGQKVLEEKFTQSPMRINFSASKLNPGIYFIRIAGEKRIQNNKLVIE